jgi:hypothetical protein
MPPETGPTFTAGDSRANHNNNCHADGTVVAVNTKGQSSMGNALGAKRTRTAAPSSGLRRL